MRGPRGQELCRAAFSHVEAGILDALDRVVGQLEGGSPVLPGLIAAIDPRCWPQTRSAVSALRRGGPSAAAAAPALAGWVVLCAGGSVTAERQYTLGEALGGLRELRDALERVPRTDLLEPSAVVAQFLDETFQPVLLTLLGAPLQIWHRGAVTYLRGRRGDRNAVAAAMNHYLVTVADDVPVPADRGWFDAARAELVTLLGDLVPAAPHPPSSPPQDPPSWRGPAAWPEPEPEPEPEPAPAPEPENETDAGPRGDLRPPRLAVDEVDLLLDVAGSHADPVVRAEALEALGAAGAHGERVLAVALAAATSTDIRERAAAVLLLSGLL